MSISSPIETIVGGSNTTQLLYEIADDRVDIKTVYTSREGILIAVVSSSISIACSVVVIILVVRSLKGLTGSVYNRIIFAICVADIIQSLAMALTTLPMPTDMIYDQFEGLSLGNTATCSAQGFFIVLGTCASVAYSATLSIYYLCSIRNDMADEDFTRRLEPYLHVASILLAVITAATAGISFANPSPVSAPWCAYANYPWWCSGEDCIRQDVLATAIGKFAPFIVTIPCLLTIIVSMIMIVIKVLRQEKEMMVTMALHSTSSANGNNYIHGHAIRAVNTSAAVASARARFLYESKIVVKEAAAYTFIHLFNFFMITAIPLIHLLSLDQAPVWQVVFLVLRPLQGVFTASVFIHHRIFFLRIGNPTLGFFSALMWALTGGEGGGDRIISDTRIVSRHEALVMVRLRGSHLRDSSITSSEDGDAADRALYPRTSGSGSDGDSGSDVDDGDISNVDVNVDININVNVNIDVDQNISSDRSSETDKVSSTPYKAGTTSSIKNLSGFSGFSNLPSNYEGSSLICRESES